MNAAAFRLLYAYHFSENRKLWDQGIMALTQEQFTRDVSYSVGSVRNQIVHLISVDATWFTALRGAATPDMLEPADFADRILIRSHWDTVEQQMREYLAALRDEMLFDKPFTEGEDKDLFLWQVLLQVVNHGTDHRAQLLRLLHDLGIATSPQDFIFYVYDNG